MNSQFEACKRRESSPSCVPSHKVTLAWLPPVRPGPGRAGVGRLPGPVFSRGPRWPGRGNAHCSDHSPPAWLRLGGALLCCRLEQTGGGQGLSRCPCGLWGQAAEPCSGRAFPHPCLLGKAEGRWVLGVLGERYCFLGQNWSSTGPHWCAGTSGLLLFPSALD